MDWFVRKMESKDHDDYLNFLSRRITSIPVKEHFHWLYQTNPHGKSITWLAVRKHNKEIIGSTSIFPKKMWVKNKIITGCVGGDTLVIPKFRRRGIAKKIHEVSLKEMREKGIQFQYGFPNAPNFGAFLKAGAFYPGDFGRLSLVLRFESILKKLRLPRRRNAWLLPLGNNIISHTISKKLSKFSRFDARFNKISKFDSRIDRLVEQTIPSLSISGIRDSNYLNWRYFQNPLKIHHTMVMGLQNELLGYTALEFYEQKCIIFDFFARNDGQVIKRFVTEIIKLALSKKCHLILFLANLKGPYVGDFMQCGFKLRKHGSSRPLIVLTDEEDENALFLNDISNWYLTYADMDLEAIKNR